MKKMTNEELALLYQQTLDESVFNEIYNRFERMINQFVRKHEIKGFIEKDELLSCCNIGLYKAVTEFPDLEIARLSPRIYRRMQCEIAHKYTYYNTKNREYLRKNSVSINLPVDTDNGTIELCEVLNYKDSEDSYFKDNFLNYESMIDYAMSKVNNEDVKEFIIPTLLGDYTQEDIAKKIGTTYQNVAYHIRKFKKYIGKYIEMNKIDLELY